MTAFVLAALPIWCALALIAVALVHRIDEPRE